jgi:erythromycin esterase-like protein
VNVEVRDASAARSGWDCVDPSIAPLIELVRTAHPLSGAASDYDRLLERFGSARLVLLGEASRGSHPAVPTWMWRNTVVRDFIGALRTHNDALAPHAPKVGFYGLDLYSLHASNAAVIDYLDTVDPAAAQRARDRYACFDYFGENP